MSFRWEVVVVWVRIEEQIGHQLAAILPLGTELVARAPFNGHLT